MRGLFKLEKIGLFLFRIRSFTPIPFVILLLSISNPSFSSIFIGTILILIGILLRSLSVRIVGEGGRGSEVGGKVLATGGPYAHVRNPIYVGNFFLSIGFVLLATGRIAIGFQWIWILACILLFTSQYMPIVLVEERFLREKFGGDYERYCRSVPRFFPKLKSFHSPFAHYPSPNTSLDWRSALRSERSTYWTVSLLYIAFLIKGWVF